MILNSRYFLKTGKQRNSRPGISVKLIFQQHSKRALYAAGVIVLVLTGAHWLSCSQKVETEIYQRRRLPTMTITNTMSPRHKTDAEFQGSSPVKKNKEEQKADAPTQPGKMMNEYGGFGKITENFGDLWCGVGKLDPNSIRILEVLDKLTQILPEPHLHDYLFWAVAPQIQGHEIPKASDRGTTKASVQKKNRNYDAYAETWCKIDEIFEKEPFLNANGQPLTAQQYLLESIRVNTQVVWEGLGGKGALPLPSIRMRIYFTDTKEYSPDVPWHTHFRRGERKQVHAVIALHECHNFRMASELPGDDENWHYEHAIKPPSAQGTIKVMPNNLPHCALPSDRVDAVGKPMKRAVIIAYFDWP